MKQTKESETRTQEPDWRDKEFQAFEEKLKEVRVDLLPVLQKANENDVIGRHRIGQVALKHCFRIKIVANLAPNHRIDPDELFHRVLGISHRTLYDFQRFAEAFSETEVQEILSQVPHATYAYFRRLLAVKDPEARKESIEKLKTEQQSFEEMDASIKRDQGPRRKGAGKSPKPPKPPADLKAGLQKFVKTIDRFRKDLAVLFDDDEFHLAGNAFIEPPDELTEQTQKYLATTIENLKEVKRQLEVEIPLLEKAQTWVDEVLAIRAQSAEMAAAETS